jgi:hypothetical protein
VVLLDAESFGGATGTRQLATEIQALNVPVFQIKNGENISAALSGRTQ